MKAMNIAVIAGTKATSAILCSQLIEVLGTYMSFHPFSVNDWDGNADMDLVLFSSHILFTRNSPVHSKNLADIVIIKRSLTKAGWERIRNLPSGNQYLVVNDERDSVVETISLLYESGLRHVDLVPYYPGVPDKYKIAFAITPGEPQLVPDYVQQTIDIGSRVVDTSTLVEILTRFNLLNHETRKLLDDYAERIVNLSQGLQVTMQGLIDAKNLYEETLNMVQDGVVTYDEKGIVNFLNRTAEKIFAENVWDVTGQKVEHFFRKHGLDVSLLKGQKEIKDQLVTVRKQRVIMNKMRIWGRGGHSESVMIFKIAQKVEELELKLRTQLRDNGHTAKFTFRDIVTRSEQIRRIIARAQKMAKHDSSVLILGENGTGKELFAHSIHNYSPRSPFPFIAVNCSALSESLLESELFGYEDGAFTGARKGGKPGLFEQAHKGTIFLDEIGDISPNLQTRLLRVLQQKEVMKVGGTKVLPVDVRVIAATNRDLYQMVKEGKFREDLYYRLKVLHIEIPPLRERKDDIPPLVQYFLERRGYNRTLSQEIMNALTWYDWPGNIRELENSIEYITIVSDEDISVEELPFISEKLIHHMRDGSAELPDPSHASDISHTLKTGRSPLPMPVPAQYLNIDIERLLLETILEAMAEGRHTGRRNLIHMIRDRGIVLKENQIRKWIDRLKDKNLVEVRIGRSGCNLTVEGYRYLKN